MRYFSVLYAPPERRAVITALYVIDAEIRESAQSPNHDVAHTRLQWWRQEIDRLVRAAPQHPAARALLEGSQVDRAAFGQLHELLAGADMDLARMTYANERELRAYCARSGGAVLEAIAAQLVAPAALDGASRAGATRIGAGVRLAEILRDLRQDATDGHLYVPLDEMERQSLTAADLCAREVSGTLRSALDAVARVAARELNEGEAQLHSTARAALRPVLVLAALHRRLLRRIAARQYATASSRIELGPIEKPWIAWRAARKAR
jgi:phytoene synthase